MSVTWCTKPGGNSVHYFGNGMDAACECGERPYFQGAQDRQCRYCLEGEMQHERNVLCVITHTPWKNCGEDCCR